MATRTPRKKRASSTHGAPSTTTTALATTTTTTTTSAPPLATSLPALNLAVLEEVTGIVTALDTAIAPYTTAGPATITDAATRTEADKALASVQAATQTVEQGLEPIIRPLYDFLESMYAIRRELQRPLIARERVLKGLMGEWDLAERRKAEEARLKREAEERAKAKAEAAAPIQFPPPSPFPPPPPTVTVMAPAIPPPVAIPPPPTYATTRFVKKWRVIDRQLFIQCAMDPTWAIPQEVEGLPVVEVNMQAVNAAMKGEGWRVVGEWPGIEVYEDAQIVGRGK